MSLSSKPHFKNLEQRGRSIEQTNPRGARAIATRSAHGNLIATDMNVHSGPSWMDPFIKYLDRGELPSTKMKKKKKLSQSRELSVQRQGTIQKEKNLHPSSDA